MRISSRYLTALKENANALGLAAAVSLSAATLSPVPPLAGIEEVVGQTETMT